MQRLPVSVTGTGIEIQRSISNYGYTLYLVRSDSARAYKLSSIEPTKLNMATPPTI